MNQTLRIARHNHPQKVLSLSLVNFESLWCTTKQTESLLERAFLECRLSLGRLLRTSFVTVGYRITGLLLNIFPLLVGYSENQKY